MKEKYKNLFFNTALLAIGSFSSKFILFFMVPLYTSVLSTEEYGITELMITSVNLIIPFITLSINDAILRFSLDKDIDSKEVLKNTFFILIFSSLIVILFKPLIELYKPIEEWSMYFIIILVLQMFRSSISLYLKSSDKVKVYSIDNVLYTICLATFNMIMLLIFDMGIYGYFISMIISMIISIIYQIIYGNLIYEVKVSKVNISLLKNMIIYSTPLICNAVSWWIINSSDRFMLEYFTTTSQVGIYSVAAKIPSLVTSVLSVFIQAWLISSIKEYEESKDPEFYKNVFSFYSIFMICMTSLFMIVIKPFIHIYVSYEFRIAWRYAPILLLAAIFTSYYGFFTSIYKAEKKNMKEVKITFMSALINIILNLITIPKYGIMGATISTMTTNLLVAVYCIVDSRKFFMFSIDFTKLIINLIIVIIQALVVIVDYYPILLSIMSFSLLIVFNHRELNYVVSYIYDTVIKKARPKQKA